MFWKPDRLLRAILIWTAVTFIIVWLPLAWSGSKRAAEVVATV